MNPKKVNLISDFNKKGENQMRVAVTYDNGNILNPRFKGIILANENLGLYF